MVLPLKRCHATAMPHRDVYTLSEGKYHKYDTREVIYTSTVYLVNATRYLPK